MNTSTIITIISRIIIPLCGAIITYFIIPWIKAKTGNARFEEIMMWVNRAVNAAEQIFPAGDNETKLDFAIRFIQEQANKRGIELTHHEIRTLVEAAVNLLPDTHTAE